MKILNFDDWYDINEEQIYIELTENGSDRELDFDPEKEFDKRYQIYLDDMRENDKWNEIAETIFLKYCKITYTFINDSKTLFLEKDDAIKALFEFAKIYKNNKK